MDAHAAEAGIDLDGTYAYGPESYDSTMLIALAAQAAGDDGSAHAGEIVNVSKGGEKCGTYAECLALIEAGTDLDYEGVSGPTDMSGNGEPIIGSYAVQVYGDDNRLDADLETFRSVEASEEFKALPIDPVTVAAGRRRRAQDRHDAAGDRQPRLPRTTGDRRACRWPSLRSTPPAATTARDVLLDRGRLRRHHDRHGGADRHRVSWPRGSTPSSAPPPRASPPA